MAASIYFILRVISIALISFLCLVSHASAGISIVDDGAGGGPAKILIQSAIRKGDLSALQTALGHVEHTATARINAVPFVTVELNSPGGDVVEALGIGREISQHLAMTLVRPGQECVSACVFIFMAGAVRTPVEGARIGLHRPLLVAWTHISSSEAHARYDGLMDYLHQYFLQLGVSQTAFDIMMRTDSFGMRYFSPVELANLHLRGESPRWEQYFATKLTAGAKSELAPAQPLASLPKLPKIDEAYRYLVFMPGAYHPDMDYFAGVKMPATHFSWASLDDDRQTIQWSRPDIRVLKNLIRAIEDMLAPFWWMIALASFEILRGAYLPRPGQRQADREQWRLRPLRQIAN